MEKVVFNNPFRPSSGHMPPYLAGRTIETQQFRRILQQSPILKNLIITGLRGVGKTVFLESIKPIGVQEDWLWVGTDMSESASITEENMALRLLTDLSIVTSNMTTVVGEEKGIGFGKGNEPIRRDMNFQFLNALFNVTPGLVSDKLKVVLERVWSEMKSGEKKGIIFAYDEAQNLCDHSEDRQYPLSLLLDVFQSLQRKEIPFMLVLTGLPTLFSELVEARTYTERMFEIITLGRLNSADSREAIQKPIQGCPFPFTEESVSSIAGLSGGYPYFIQFICREVYDIFSQQYLLGHTMSVPFEAIISKLDSEFFAPRWGKATDRQRVLLYVIAQADDDCEFTVQEVTEKSATLLEEPFGSSNANQMIAKLVDMGFVYRNRHGKYMLAVPLLKKYILRQSIVGLKNK